MRHWIWALFLLAIAVAPAVAAPTAAATSSATVIPGPLGKDSGLLEGAGTMRISFLPKDENAPVATFGEPVPVMLVAKAQAGQGNDHPFELFIAIADVPAEGAAVDLTRPFVRCGTITADGAAPVPGGAISATHSTTGKNKNDEGRTTYSVAPTKKVAVGLVDFPKLAAAAGLEDSLKHAIPATAFSLSVERDTTLQFFAESPFKDGTLAIMIVVPTWTFTEQ